MFPLIRAGIVGGKTVPESVAENPLVFATLTAPSFGHVHGHRDGTRRCRPRDRAMVCEHGRPTDLSKVHGPETRHRVTVLSDCYDYASARGVAVVGPGTVAALTIALRRVWQRWGPESG